MHTARSVAPNGEGQMEIARDRPKIRKASNKRAESSSQLRRDWNEPRETAANSVVSCLNGSMTWEKVGGGVDP